MQVRHPGVPPTHAEAAPPALTRREDEVLRLIALGKCNKEIAATVGISPRTVKFHITNLLLKFGVSSRLELLAKTVALSYSRHYQFVRHRLAKTIAVPQYSCF